jgi:hypothetical protein
MSGIKLEKGYLTHHQTPSRTNKLKQKKPTKYEKYLSGFSLSYFLKRYQNYRHYFAVKREFGMIVREMAYKGNILFCII